MLSRWTVIEQFRKSVLSTNHVLSILSVDLLWQLALLKIPNLHIQSSHNKKQELKLYVPAMASQIYLSFSGLFILARRSPLKYRNFETNIPRKGISGPQPNFHIHVSVSHLYISMISLPILLEEICRPILGLYKSLTDTWMLKLGLRPRYSQKRNTYVGFSLQCRLISL